MGSRKTLILVASVAIAAIGGFILFGWLGSVQDRANADAATVDVWVVKQDIPAGTYGQEAATVIQKAHQQKQFVPANAIKNPKEITDRVAAAPLLKNQTVTSDMFVSPNSAAVDTGIAGRLEKVESDDMTAITITVDQTRGVAGLIQPGDFVNIMSVGICEGTCPEDAEELLLAKQARYIYQKAEVLAIDKRPKLNASEQIQANSEANVEGDEGDVSQTTENEGLITLRVPAVPAQWIATLPPENIYLTLVGRDYEPQPQGPIPNDAPLPAENAEVLTPYGKDGLPENK